MFWFRSTIYFIDSSFFAVENIFTTSCQRITDAPINALKGELNVQFVGEAGMGSGVRREWFDNLSQEVLNPDYALFTQSADGGWSLCCLCTSLWIL